MLTHIETRSGWP